MVELVVNEIVVNFLVVVNEMVKNVIGRVVVILEGMFVVYFSLVVMVFLLIFFGFFCLVKYFIE